MSAVLASSQVPDIPEPVQIESIPMEQASAAAPKAKRGAPKEKASKEKQVTPKPKAPKAPAVTEAPKEKQPAAHPPWADMIVGAIRSLNDKNGSSIPAIKKYIVSTYNQDADKLTPLMKRGLKAALNANKVQQIKGKGLTGSFKLVNPEAKKTGSAGRKSNAAKSTANPKGQQAKTKKTKSPTKKKAASPAKIAIKPKTPKTTTKKTEATGTGAPAKNVPTKEKKAPTKAKATAKPKVVKVPATPKGEATKKAPMKAKSAKAPRPRKAPKPKTHKGVASPKPAAAARGKVK